MMARSRRLLLILLALLTFALVALPIDRPVTATAPPIVQAESSLEQGDSLCRRTVRRRDRRLAAIDHSGRFPRAGVALQLFGLGLSEVGRLAAVRSSDRPKFRSANGQQPAADFGADF
ncbi:MAG: hypothetical protein HC895_01840 [Leptolyngbyaceae cyanobacterium SM1_3_5]|nr:hypothetical protein [Leptolyngbyaceae cyanobacterium SM1_3_5]